MKKTLGRTPIWRGVAGLAAVALLLCSCSRNPTASAGTGPPEPPTVAVAKVEDRDLGRNLILRGDLQPYREVDVVSNAAGSIRDISVKVGDRARKGQLLATVEIPQVAEDLRRADDAQRNAQDNVQLAQNELDGAKATHEIAALTYQRLAALAARQPGLVAPQELDTARRTETAAAAGVASATSALAAARRQAEADTAAVQKVPSLVNESLVVAPFDGVITRRYVNPGAIPQSGPQSQAMPVVRISQDDLLRLFVPVPPSAAPGIRIGEEVQVRVPALRRGFSGIVSHLGGPAAPSGGEMQAELVVPNPSLVLASGMRAEVDLRLGRGFHALAVPVESVNAARGAAAGYVTVVTPDHRVEMRRVELGLETANLVEVRSGLSEGEMVVLNGRSALSPGQEIRPKPAAPAEAQP